EPAKVESPVNGRSRPKAEVCTAKLLAWKRSFSRPSFPNYLRYDALVTLGRPQLARTEQLDSDWSYAICESSDSYRTLKARGSVSAWIRITSRPLKVMPRTWSGSFRSSKARGSRQSWIPHGGGRVALS